MASAPGTPRTLRSSSGRVRKRRAPSRGGSSPIQSPVSEKSPKQNHIAITGQLKRSADAGRYVRRIVKRDCSCGGTDGLEPIYLLPNTGVLTDTRHCSLTLLDATLALLLAAQIHSSDSAIKATAKRCVKRLPRSKRDLMFSIVDSSEPLRLVRYIAENLD